MAAVVMTQHDKLRVGVVGAGRMGAAMVGRLREAGHPVAVFNRTRSRADEVAATTGASVAGTAREAAAEADVIVVSLADDSAVQAAYDSAEGLVAGLRPGAVVLEASTVHPDTIRALAPLVTQRSAALLDTPVSGSVPSVQSGKLTIMVGGDAAALERARPVLDVLATRIFHLGESGTGAAMKLAVNSLLLGLNQALAEALVLAEKAGVPRHLAYDVFAASAVGAPFVQYKRAAFERPEEAEAAFMLGLAAKDLGLADSLARSVGARMDQLATNRRVALEAIAAGYGQRDLSAIAVLLRGQPDSPS
jgi:3-hydroxyisobutyrate dehydrogenase-like beta-hydroxyacid dehydrogenase